jgi:hypothetical protein
MGRNLLVLGGSIATTYCHPAYMSVYGGDYQPEYVERLFLELRVYGVLRSSHSPALGKELSEAFARYAAPDFRAGDFYYFY